MTPALAILALTFAVLWLHTRRDLRNCTACWEHERRQHEEWHQRATELQEECGWWQARNGAPTIEAAELRLIIEEKDLQIAELRAVAAGRLKRAGT